jgi:hypothetical protein
MRAAEFFEYGGGGKKKESILNSHDRLARIELN